MNFPRFVEFNEEAMPWMWRLVADNWNDAKLEALGMLAELDGANVARIVDQGMNVRTFTPAKDDSTGGWWTTN